MMTNPLGSFYAFKSSLCIREIGIRGLFAALGAHIIVLNGHIESFFEALTIPSYYKAFLPSFIFAYLLCTLVSRINRGLDKKYDWEHHTLLRVVYQFLCGLLLPLLLNLGFAALFFKWVHHLNLRDTSFLESEIRIIFIMLLLLNCYYITLNFYNQLKKARNHPKVNSVLDKAASKVIYAPAHPLSHYPSAEGDVKKDNDFPQVFMIHTATQSFPLKTSEIAYIYRSHRVNFIRTKSGEDYMISETLKEMEASFAGRYFFRINRQMLVSFESCRSYQVGNQYGTLLLQLHPPFGTSSTENATVSEDRVNDFKMWMMR